MDRRNTLLILTALLLLVPLTLPSAAPDLTGSVQVQVTPLDGLAQVDYSVSISNAGNQACAGTWWADFWASYPCTCDVHPLQCNQAPDKFWEFSGGQLGPGASKAEQVSRQLPPAPVPYRYLLFVDSVDNLCVEGNESNNIVCGEYTVSLEASKPDLEIVSCKAENDPLAVGNTLYTLEVRNNGPAPVSVPVGVDLFTDVEEQGCEDFFNVPGDAWIQSPPLPAGQTTLLTKSVAVDSGPRRLLALVNGFGEVFETTTANNCCEFEYVVANRPDLTIPEFDATVQGDKPLFIGKIRNDGFEHVKEGQQFKLCIYYNSTSQPNLCETPDVEAGGGKVEAFVEGLEVGAEIPFAVYAPTLPNGVYSVWARADCDCEILETDEKNNDAKKTLALDVPGPDLQVKLFSGAQAKQDGVNAVRFLVLVTNAGTDPITAPFDLDLFFNHPTLPTLDDAGAIDEGVYVQGPPMAPGDFFQSEVVWTRPGGIPDGTYTAWAVLDLFDAWWETDETNNASSVEVQVVTKGGPNLDLSEFRSRVVGNQVVFSMSVSNNGDTDIDTPFRIDLFRDRESPPQFGDLGDDYQIVERLAAGGTLSWESTWDQAPDGEYLAFGLLDTNNQVPDEANKADNVAGPRIVVVCSSCQTCPEDIFVSSPCVCGEETVYSGYCCGGQWFALGCQTAVDSTEEVTQGEPQIVEFQPPLKKSSSCSTSELPSTRSVLLLVLLLILAISLARCVVLKR